MFKSNARGFDLTALPRGNSSFSSQFPQNVVVMSVAKTKPIRILIAPVALLAVAGARALALLHEDGERVRRVFLREQITRFEWLLPAKWLKLRP